MEINKINLRRHKKEKILKKQKKFSRYISFNLSNKIYIKIKKKKNQIKVIH